MSICRAYFLKSCGEITSLVEIIPWAFLPLMLKNPDLDSDDFWIFMYCIYIYMCVSFKYLYVRRKPNVSMYIYFHFFLNKNFFSLMHGDTFELSERNFKERNHPLDGGCV